MTPQDQDRMLLGRLRTMWEQRDPVPDELVPGVLAALAAERIDEEYEVLTLVDSTERLAGTRGGPETRTLTFSSGSTTVMVRISVLAGDRRRLDGWVTPAGAYDVRLTNGRQTQGSGELSAVATPLGRFELADLGPGTVTLRLMPLPPDGHAPGADDGDHARDAVCPLWLTTPPFTI